jgi:hypothetical protein
MAFELTRFFFTHDRDIGHRAAGKWAVVELTWPL